MWQVVGDRLADDFPPLRTLDARPNNLPRHLNSFVGRQGDVAEVRRLTTESPLVTLTGPGRRWVINAEHRLLLDAISRRDVVDAERFLAGHIRRTRIELGKHPEIFAR